MIPVEHASTNFRSAIKALIAETTADLAVRNIHIETPRQYAKPAGKGHLPKGAYRSPSKHSRSFAQRQ
jgi:hypothetical protein